MRPKSRNLCGNRQKSTSGQSGAPLTIWVRQKNRAPVTIRGPRAAKVIIIDPSECQGPYEHQGPSDYQGPSQLSCCNVCCNVCCYTAVVYTWRAASGTPGVGCLGAPMTRPPGAGRGRSAGQLPGARESCGEEREGRYGANLRAGR